MINNYVYQVMAMLDAPDITGKKMCAALENIASPYADIQLTSVNYEPPEDCRQQCDFIKIVIKGTEGKQAGGRYPTFGLIGRLGAQQAQPLRCGLVSDADGSIVALAAAMKLLAMSAAGVRLPGDVIISTHIATHVSITRREPADFMGMPVSSATMNRYEVDKDMDAILSVDTSKGNRIIKHRGMAISPVALQGYILRVAEGLLTLLERATGRAARTFPITSQDISPYDNGVYHFNSIMQPHVASDAPVVGLAITAAAIVAGSETGASYSSELVDATLFSVEVAKQFTANHLQFYDRQEFQRLRELYGDFSALQGRTGVME